MCIYRVSLTHVHVCICDSWLDPKFKIFHHPSSQAENIDMCINMAPSMPTDNKRHKKKLATFLCPVIIMLVESRFIFICNNPPPPPPTALFRKTYNTHMELFPKFGPQNKFFDNHEYNRRSLNSSWTVEY